MQDSFGVPEIHPDEIEMEQLIGEGTYGQVFSGRCRGKEVAVKVFKESMIRSHEDLQSIRDEVSTMSRIYHPNVVLFMGACAIPGKSLMIVTEKMPTDLDTLLIKKKSSFTLYKKLRMAKDAALGMNWLHSSDPVFIHRDLKLSNLLVDQNYKVCVCDFGLTQAKPKDVSNLEYDPHGSPLYMAPEVFFGDYNEKCDIYSFGIGLWEMITQKEAFEEINGNLAQFVEAVCYNDYRPPIPDGIPSSLVKLMNRCWGKDARSRPSMSEIVQELDLVAIDSAIQDEHGRKLWKSLFRDKEEVGWDEFKEGICDYLSIPDPQHDDQRFKCLEAILASKPQTLKNSSIEKVVNIEKFGHTCQWFGPFKTAADGSNLLNKLSSILSEKWFHGDITQDQAEDRLRDQEKGTFLIRFSSAPGFFTLSLLTKKKILHQRIEHTGDGYTFGEEKYSTMANLIKEQRKKLSLVQPCAGSPYRKLFPSSKGKPQVDIGAYVAPVGKK